MAVYNVAAIVVVVVVAVSVVVAAAAFSRQTPAYIVLCSFQSWVSASLAVPHVAAAVRTAAGIEESYCCVGKGAVDAVGDWLDLDLDLEDTGFAPEEIHNLKKKML